MELGTAAIPLGASLLSSADRLKNERLKITAQNQALMDKFEDDLKSWDFGVKSIHSDKPTDFYATSNNPTINLTGPASNDISSTEIQDHIKKLYADAFGRDPVFNDDMSDTADYWVGAVQRGDQGDRKWQDWLNDSIYGSQEYKTQGPGLTPHDKDWIESLNRSGGGGRYKGPTLADFQSMLQGIFSNPWTPYGFGWGGTNSDAVRINQSQASRRGSSYAGNKSSFNRSGSRLNTQGTPWMNTLGM